MHRNSANEQETQAQEIAALGDWFHNIHLPSGLETAPAHPLGDFPAHKWRNVQACLPADLTGWRVLDIGCNAGFYSFALAERGADVLGVDVDPRYLAQAEWVTRQLALRTPPSFQRLSVYEIGKLNQTFDLTWFMGVAYHLRHPLLALDLIRSVTRGHLMFQMMTFPDAESPPVPPDFPLTERHRIAAPGWPKLGFVEHRLAHDPTNWWVTNSACAEAMLRSSGFSVLAAPEHETYWCETAPIDEAVQGELTSVLGARAEETCVP